MRPLVVLVEFLVKPPFTAQFRDLIAFNAKASLDREVGCKRSMYSSIQRSHDISSSTRSTRIESHSMNISPRAITGVSQTRSRAMEQRTISRLAFSSAMATSGDDFT